jgi:hypothetical protein
MQYLISSKDEHKILKRKDSDATEHGVCVFYSSFCCIVSRLGFCWKWGLEMICFERGERVLFGWWKCLSIQTLIWQLPWSFLQWNVVGPYLLHFFLLEISPCDSTSCWEIFFHLSTHYEAWNQIRGYDQKQSRDTGEIWGFSTSWTQLRLKFGGHQFGPFAPVHLESAL